MITNTKLFKLFYTTTMSDFMPVTERMINVPAFELPNGISFNGGLVSESLEYLGTDKPAYELSVGSLTHADQSALYLLGLFTKMERETGTKIVEAPEAAKEAALRHYETIHADKDRGNWNFDAVDYDMEPPAGSGLFLPKGYEIDAWLIRPEWKKVDGVYVPTVGEDTELVYAEMPPNGYGPVPTAAGLRHPKTGWALDTLPDRTAAIDKLAEYFSKFVDEAGARELAKEEVSYSYRRSRDSGKSVVFRDFDLGDDGPFYEDADWDGGDRKPKHEMFFSLNRGLGSFSSRSSAKEKQIQK